MRRKNVFGAKMSFRLEFFKMMRKRRRWRRRGAGSGVMIETDWLIEIERAFPINSVWFLNFFSIFLYSCWIFYNQFENLYAKKAFSSYSLMNFFDLILLIFFFIIFHFLFFNFYFFIKLHYKVTINIKNLLRCLFLHWWNKCRI